jgi:hypothetical protein
LKFTAKSMSIYNIFINKIKPNHTLINNKISKLPIIILFLTKQNKRMKNRKE